MRVSQRTRRGTVSMGLGELLVWAFFLGPLLLAWWTLVGVVRLVVWVWREYATARAAREALTPGNHVAPPNRHH